MKIKKLGHCCVLIETGGIRILTDPGVFTVDQHSELRDIDCIVITHEHGDHCHTDSVQTVLAHNPTAQVVCNSSVGALLSEVGITYICVEGQKSTRCSEVTLTACESTHAEIYQEVGQVQSTGYLIDGRLFLPADSWQGPEQEVEILALPVAGPWCRIADAITFAIAVGPKVAFPVHDGLLTQVGKEITYKHPHTQLPSHGIDFIPLADSEEIEV